MTTKIVQDDGELIGWSGGEDSWVVEWAVLIEERCCCGEGTKSEEHDWAGCGGYEYKGKRLPTLEDAIEFMAKVLGKNYFHPPRIRHDELEPTPTWHDYMLGPIYQWQKIEFVYE